MAHPLADRLRRQQASCLGDDFFHDCNASEYTFDVASGYSSFNGGTCPAGKEIVSEQVGKEFRPANGGKWVCLFRVSCKAAAPKPNLPSPPPPTTEQPPKARPVIALGVTIALLFVIERAIKRYV